MRSGQEVENQIVLANTQMQQIEYAKDFVSSKEDNE